MAEDWIKMRTRLADDPAVISISLELGLDRDTVVGKLHRLWSWATDQLADGYAAGVTESYIDAHVGVIGFARAMKSAGWLTLKARSVSFPGWEKHLSQGAKQRSLAAKRVSDMRLRKCNAAIVTKSLPEKEKEYKYPPNPPKGGDERPRERRKREAAEADERRRRLARWWLALDVAYRESLARKLEWPQTVNLYAAPITARLESAAREAGALAEILNGQGDAH